MAWVTEAQQVAYINSDQGSDEGGYGEAAEVRQCDTQQRRNYGITVQRATYAGGMLQMQKVWAQGQRLYMARNM